MPAGHIPDPPCGPPPNISKAEKRLSPDKKLYKQTRPLLCRRAASSLRTAIPHHR